MKELHSLEELYEKYRPVIYSYLYYQTGERVAAEDLCQEVFIKAFKGLSSYRGECSVKTWLYTIAHNLYVSWYKKESKYEILDIGDVNENGLLSDIGLPEATVEKREKAESVWKVLNGLKEEHRTVIILRDLLEFSYEEIGSLMNWSLSKVKITIYRARIQFKTLYESEGGNI